MTDVSNHLRQCATLQCKRIDESDGDLFGIARLLVG